MEIIQLPAILTLPNILPLEEINEKLRNKTAKLSWNGVVSASEDALTLLLTGIDLEDDCLNLTGGESDHLVTAIVKYFENREDNQGKIAENPEITENPVTIEPSEIIDQQAIAKQQPSEIPNSSQPHITEEKTGKKQRKSKESLDRQISSVKQPSFIESRYIPNQNPDKNGNLFQEEITLKAISTQTPENSAKVNPDEAITNDSEEINQNNPNNELLTSSQSKSDKLNETEINSENNPNHELLTQSQVKPDKLNKTEVNSENNPNNELLTKTQSKSDKLNKTEVNSENNPNHELLTKTQVKPDKLNEIEINSENNPNNELLTKTQSKSDKLNETEVNSENNPNHELLTQTQVKPDKLNKTEINSENNPNNDLLTQPQVKPDKLNKIEVNSENNPDNEEISSDSPNLENTDKTKQIPVKKIPILQKATHYAIRQQLIEAIYTELLGPTAEDEEVDEPSLTERYLVGLLAPKIRSQHNETPDLQDDIGVTDKGNPDEGSQENTVPPPSMFPSSMGITFCVDENAQEIEITAKWGQYKKQDSEYLPTEKGNPKKVWKRYPREGTKIITLENNREIPQWVICPDEAPSVYLEGKMRRMADKGWIITIFLVNGQQEPSSNRDTAWLFQTQLTVKSANPHKPDIFVKKAIPRHLAHQDPAIFYENQMMAMLYRHHVEFAVGHGVSIHANTLANNPQRAIELTTKAIPAYEIPKTTPPTAEEIPDLARLSLDMEELAHANPQDLPNLLNPLIKAYSNWIDSQEQRIDNPEEDLQPYHFSATQQIERCRQALSRIEEGITLLTTHSQAVEAFQYMNKAMALQRIHSIYSEKQRRGEDSQLNDHNILKNRSWYPFQLAFILLNLPSLTDLHHRDRINPDNAIADLLWFPTGGGKTEAYLGLTAYTIAIRRLQGVIGGRDGNYGVTVLMRYTLRLLTLQQFQRATALICACEAIRLENPSKWGKEPIRIGLWVGQKNTPNYTSQSEEFVKQKRGQKGQNGKGSPHQLTNCPWCGSKIDAGKHIHVETVEKGRGRTYIKCGDKLGRCIFSRGEGLPVIVVDEEIYRRLPTLLIATVDKFAQMPWKGEVQMLFGQINGYCDRHGFRSPDIDDTNSHKAINGFPTAKTHPHLKLRPPDLIIQDELHLISGPLGSLVGLYETAIDKLSTWEVNGETVHPKIIASTATIKQAQTQVHYLFNRKLAIFPPQCLDISDNFFSRQRIPCEDTPGRMYLGICATGRRLKAAMIRVYLAVMSASQSLYEIYGTQADPWMTLVGYFNSLRELGGTRRLVDDDITTRLKRMEQRGLANRSIRQIEELTSRKDSTDIPDILDHLETPFDPQKEAEMKARRKAGEKIYQKYPLDVILATNMISVGVDVKRLGVMVACGQPKNTAEYIQATSRVGRTYPGLVITVYNWARPRDLSHYERFAHYHATFYQNVEALSVTPFASGALYRGLSALLVTLVRLMGEDFNGNDKAGIIERNHPYIQSAIDIIIQRAIALDGQPTGENVRQELNAKLDTWLNRIKNLTGGASLKYQITSKDGTSINLIEPAGKGDWKAFTCLNSLRNVEPSVNLILTDQPPDDEKDRLPQPFIESP